MVRLPQNEKQIYRLNIRPEMWPSVSAEMEWMGRALLVEVKHEAHSANLLKLDQIDMAVKVFAHRSLNLLSGFGKQLKTWQMKS